MRRRAFALAVPVGIAGHVTTARAQVGEHRQAIEALFINFSAAYGRSDADAIGALFTEDAVLIGPAPIITGRRAISQNYKDRLDQGFSNIRFQLLHRDPGGVWVAGTYTVTLPQAGGERLGNFTSIFRLQANALLIHVHTFNFRG